MRALIGTWQSKPGEVRKAVAYALQDGYRHIDAALYVQIYFNGQPNPVSLKLT